MSKSNITYLTDVALITCVINNDRSDVVLQAARNAGAITGAISYQARGYGVRERLGLLGIAVETEKEVISILVSSEQRDTVCNSIYRVANMDTPGHGYLYITPLERFATYMPQDIVSKLEEGS